MKTSRVINNIEIAELLRDVAAAYKIKGENNNRFKVVAYERAADAVEHLSSEAKDLWDDDKLEDVSGIGKSIASHLGEIFTTGRSKHFDDLMSDLPPAMFELMKVPGIGAKTAIKLSDELNIKEKKGAVKKLEVAIKKGKIAPIEGFGEQSQESIQKSIKETKGRTIRTILPYALEIAGDMLAWLKEDSNVVQADVLGSLRRKVATVGDIDLAAATKNPQKTLDHFAKYPKKTRVLEKGSRTASIIIPGNKQVDLMVETPAAYGALLQHFTGSKHHNIALRELANKKGISISDYGIRKVSKKKEKKYQKIATEKELYGIIGLEWIPPELREDTGEIEAAGTKKLPNLIKLKDIKADLQIHSNYDIETSHDLGQSSMQETVKRGSELGYQYLAFTEHNPSKSGHNQKQTTDILKRKREAVDNLNFSLSKSKGRGVKKVFNSLEIDILPNGEIPVGEEGLQTLDFALVSIHSSFKQPRDKMTKRVLSALSRPKVKIFAHPTARKINHRESVELDWPEIFDFCLKHDKWIEINAEPMRLDLPDMLVRDAVKKGVKLTLGTDSHHIDQMVNMQYGVWVARRGWAISRDIVNTRNLSEFEKMIQ